MKNNSISITPAEWKIMTALWNSGQKMTIGMILGALPEKENWSKGTIKTLIRRLYDKGAVAYEEKRFFRYYPAVSEEECLKEEMKDIMSRLFSSSPTKLVNTLVEAEDLSNDDIDDIIDILETIRKRNE